MNIQSNINQSLSVAAMLMSQTPLAATQKEKALEKHQVKQTQKFADKAGKMIEAVPGEIEDIVQEQSENFKKLNGKEPTIEQKKQWAEGHAKAQSFLADQYEIATRELFAAIPTEETYEAYARNAAGAKDIEAQKQKYFAKLDKEMEAKAEEAKLREQKRLSNNLYMLNRRGTNNGK